MATIEPAIPQSRNVLVLYGLLLLVNAAILLGLASTPGLAPDYRSFYVAGQMARSSPSAIYNWDRQSEAQSSTFGDARFLPFFHPPQELLLLAPLSSLPFARSLLLWRILNVVFLVIAGKLLADALHLERLPTIVQAASLFPIAFCLFQGQDSILLLVIVCWSFRLLCRRADVAAGIVLSLALFKPQLPVVIVLALLALGRSRFVLAFAASAAAAVAASVAYLGAAGARQLIVCARLAEFKLPISRMPTLRGLLACFMADRHALAALLALLCLVVFFPIWQRSRSLEFAFASATCLGSIIALHLYAYDLSVLAVPIAIMARHWTPLEKSALAPFYLAPLFLALVYFNDAALLVLCTAFLCVATFRLRRPQTVSTAPQVALVC